MDGEGVSQQEFAACIEDLARVNTWTLGRGPTLAFIRRALKGRAESGAPVIIDVGYGAGDMLRAIARRLAREGRSARLVGFDINPRSEPVARRLSPADLKIDFRTGDALAIPAHEPVDIVISSLVTHHMEDDEIVRFLQWMESRAGLGWFVNDLHRHWLSYHGFRVLAAAMRWHPFVRHDGPLSIARAFRREDWDRLLKAAGLAGKARVRWKFPFRYCVERVK
jgi:SAM-dependent methyltransferase